MDEAMGIVSKNRCRDRLTLTGPDGFVELQCQKEKGHALGQYERHKWVAARQQKLAANAPHAAVVWGPE